MEGVLVTIEIIESDYRTTVGPSILDGLPGAYPPERRMHTLYLLGRVCAVGGGRSSNCTFVLGLSWICELCSPWCMPRAVQAWDPCEKIGSARSKGREQG